MEEEEGAVATSAADADMDVDVGVDVDVLSPVHRVASADEAAVTTPTSHTAAATHNGKGF